MFGISRMLPPSGVVLVLALAAALSLVASQPVTAQDEEEPEGEVPEWLAEGRNIVGGFLGLTTSDGETGPSIGFDYEYRRSLKFGIGGMLEYTGANFREGIVAFAFYWHPQGRLRLTGATGIDIQRDDKNDEFLIRLGGTARITHRLMVAYLVPRVPPRFLFGTIV